MTKGSNLKISSSIVTEGGTRYYDALETLEPDQDRPNGRNSSKKKSRRIRFRFRCCRRRRCSKSNSRSNGNEQANQDGDDFCLNDSDTGCLIYIGSQESENPHSNIDPYKIHKKGTARRKRIPNRPNESMNLWTILKSNIGKDLTKIAIPVHFSEPISMLQRLTEDYEYSYLLDKASKCTDSCEQMCYVAAFTISSYASTGVRTAKPFNPLLGETFECDRMDERGWRCISEQVSHHPPTAALHCESKAWICWQDFTMSQKWKGNSLEIIPLGMAHLTFSNSAHHYTWRKVTTTIHNLVFGKLWVDQVGDMIIKNHTTGDICRLKYVPAGYFTQSKEVIGTVEASQNGPIRYHLKGVWDEKLVAYPLSRIQSKKLTTKRSARSLDGLSGETIWRIKPLRPGADLYYNFSEFACELNELEYNVAPTDSRNRPDQRLMECGKWDLANNEKLRLEEKQRAARNERKAQTKKSKSSISADEVEPVWFHKDHDKITGTKMYKYGGQYWDCKEAKDWTRCKLIF